MSRRLCAARGCSRLTCSRQANSPYADNGLTEAVERARRSLYLRVRATFDDTLVRAQRVRDDARRVREEGALRIASELARFNRERAGLALIRQAIRPDVVASA